MEEFFVIEKIFAKINCSYKRVYGNMSSFSIPIEFEIFCDSIFHNFERLQNSLKFYAAKSSSLQYVS